MWHEALWLELTAGKIVITWLVLLCSLLYHDNGTLDLLRARVSHAIEEPDRYDFVIFEITFR